MDTVTRHRIRDKKFTMLGNGDDIKRTRKSKFRSSYILRIFFFFMVVVLFYLDIMYMKSSINVINTAIYKVNLLDLKYVIVIDAGSTGSRAVCFSLYQKVFLNEIELVDEHRVVTKPGISAYANSPRNASLSIAKLVDEIIENIPENQRIKTPIIFRATAGLRLLPNMVAEELLDAIRHQLKVYPFLIDEGSVQIMKGEDEGLFSWITVNYLLGKLNSVASKTVATLDLGGGSTQVSLLVTLPDILRNTPGLYKIQPFDDYRVYSRSYLGLGLKAARHEILTQHIEVTTITSPCVNSRFRNITWHYDNDKHIISGMIRDLADFNKCSNIVRDFVMSHVDEIEELPLREIIVFSYFFDKALQNNVIDTESGGFVIIKQFKDAARKVCLEAKNDRAFACVDLVFIWNLLEFGYRLREDTKIKVLRKIDGHEISWALGLAIHTVQKRSLQ